VAVLGAALLPARAVAQPTLVDKKLAVRTVAAGLSQPVAMAFIDDADILVIEKASGQVKRFTGGAPAGTVLDLAVNSSSERGLLGIVTHPQFPAAPWVYLYWTESSTGADSNVAANVPLLGNRIDRFVWDGSTLAFDRNIVRLRSYQADAGQPVRGNHNGGVLRFGPDGTLFAVIGDNGRRGQMQNLANGPFGPGIPDDQYGGPAPDAAHLTGVVLRLNDDGSAPVDNPFFGVGAAIGGEVGANLQKVYAYGVRNSFGLAIDPYSGDLWETENGDDAFDEINRIEPGHNGGWIRAMGPIDRVAEFKAIELALGGASLQQVRWPPTNIADTPGEAYAQLFMLPGAHYGDPVFSWKYAVAPAALGFLSSRALGPQYEGDLFVGASRPTLANGYLFRFNITGNRLKIGVDDPRLEDRVADNTAKFDITESEDLLFGSGFGVGTDIHTGPNGNLYVVSLTNNVVYEIYKQK
jgi:glucose/arabinose dehydrogenase